MKKRKNLQSHEVYTGPITASVFARLVENARKEANVPKTENLSNKKECTLVAKMLDVSTSTVYLWGWRSKGKRPVHSTCTIPRIHVALNAYDDKHGRVRLSKKEIADLRRKRQIKRTSNIGANKNVGCENPNFLDPKFWTRFSVVQLAKVRASLDTAILNRNKARLTLIEAMKLIDENGFDLKSMLDEAKTA